MAQSSDVLFRAVLYPASGFLPVNAHAEINILNLNYISGFLPVKARLPVNAHLIFLCWRSRTKASRITCIQNGRLLVFPVKTADNRDKL